MTTGRASSKGMGLMGSEKRIRIGVLLGMPIAPSSGYTATTEGGCWSATPGAVRKVGIEFRLAKRKRPTQVGYAVDPESFLRVGWVAELTV